MKTFNSDGLLYVYKTYKVIKLYRHVSLYNSIIIVIQTNMSVLTYYFITERFWYRYNSLFLVYTISHTF